MERDKSLDILRAFAILFVIFGHITHVSELRQYIWGFHIPLFFAISGFLFNQEKYGSLRVFLKAKRKALVVPYVFFYVITLVYWIVVESRIRSGGVTWYMELMGMVYGTYSLKYMFFNGALWFMPCLFSIELLYWFIAKMNCSWLIFVVLIIFNVLGISFVDYLYWLPWGLNAAMIGLIFFGLGNLIKSKKEFIAELKWYYWGGIIVSASVLQFFTFGYSHTDLASLSFSNPFLYVPVALIGIVLYFSIAKIIKKNFFLEWLGKNTLVLFALQEPVYRAVLGASAKILNIDVEIIRINVGLSVLCTIVTIALIAPFVVLYNKYISNLLKKKV